MATEPPYNPLDARNLGESVANALLERKPVALPPPTFRGAGIYAIYYTGCFEVYKVIAQANRQDNCSIPVYVGKAVPKGARSGGQRRRTISGNVLVSRLKEHAKSIDQANNLKLSDFSCRYLVVDEIWIPLGESLIIERFSPIWNTRIDGFGNHDPGRGRRNQARSHWDVLHPGRPWATKLEPPVTPDDVAKLID